MMKKNWILRLLVVVFFFSVFPHSGVYAQDQTPPRPESDNGDIVCPPGYNDLYPAGSCLTPGSSSEASSAQIEPQPLFSTDISLSYVPFSYFKLDEQGTALYPSLDSAMSGSGAIQNLGPGFVYISYAIREETPNGVFYALDDNYGWIKGAGSRMSPGVFQGVELGATPRTPFGWVVTGSDSRARPDYNLGNYAVRSLFRFQIVNIYETVTAAGVEWFRIGKNEWIESRNIGAVFPNPTPPEGVTNGRWIEVNLAEQTLMVYDQKQLVFATLISSGADPFWTRPGLFQIYMKKDTENMTGAFAADRSDYYYLQNVPWTMYFDKARALHGAYWHTYFGYPQSHGCVNLSLGDSNWLYHWAVEGDWVWVHDPSGVTPTDPAIYGEGGA